MCRALRKRAFLVCFLLLYGCSGLEESEKEKLRQRNAVGERIHRSQHEYHFLIPPPQKRIRTPYPWEASLVGKQIKITKEFFKCRGSGSNPPLFQTVNGQPKNFVDCDGPSEHSLPYREGKEYIYPCLLELLNYIQEKTEKKVIITCGYRCPAHNAYADESSFNETSKHMIGGEVDFYVKGWEWAPEKVVNLLMEYYQDHPEFQSDPQFCQFKRYEKQTNVVTWPWYNKEIMIKLFQKEEGRDRDNDHRFPYICIQLRWDRETQAPVTYSWRKAFDGYLRY